MKKLISILVVFIITVNVGYGQKGSVLGYMFNSELFNGEQKLNETDTLYYYKDEYKQQGFLYGIQSQKEAIGKLIISVAFSEAGMALGILGEKNYDVFTVNGKKSVNEYSWKNNSYTSKNYTMVDLYNYGYQYTYMFFYSHIKYKDEASYIDITKGITINIITADGITRLNHTIVLPQRAVNDINQIYKNYYGLN